MSFIHTLCNTIYEYEYYLVICEFKMVNIDYHYCPCITSNLSDNNTMCSRQNCFLVKLIDDFKNKGYKFNDQTERNIIPIANKKDRSYDFHIKRNTHAAEWE